MTKSNSFVKQFVAIIKGDDAEAKAQKVWRQAESGLKVHIAKLEGDLVDYEAKVEEATDALASARVNNGMEITDRNSYVGNLKNANLELQEAKDRLDDLKYTIDFLKSEYKALKEVK